MEIEEEEVGISNQLPDSIKGLAQTLHSPSAAYCNPFSIHFRSESGQTLAITFPFTSANGSGP